MPELNIGTKAPDFSLTASDGNTYTLKQFRGQKVILYFYPQDDTETCTKQACSFRDSYAELTDKGAVLLGISPDGEHSHQQFVKKYQLNFPVLSDTDRSISEAYGVWSEKTMFGRTYMGVLRTTFIIDGKGMISHVFPRVRVKGQIERILKALEE